LELRFWRFSMKTRRQCILTAIAQAWRQFIT
jgi:hypothetical protein